MHISLSIRTYIENAGSNYDALMEMTGAHFPLRSMTSLAMCSWLDFRNRHDFPPVEKALHPIRQLDSLCQNIRATIVPLGG